MKCNICGGDQFEDFRGRKGARCATCGALERHRAAWEVLRRLDAGALLHFAPEPCMDVLDGICTSRHTTDKFMRGVDYQCDIQRMHFDGDSFDAIYCSHVLEHVEDDMVALNEMRRVLKPDGWACIVIPVHKGKTIGRGEWTGTPEHFGQADHVRRYGDDAAQRMGQVFGSVVDHGRGVFMCQGFAGPQGQGIIEVGTHHPPTA